MPKSYQNISLWAGSLSSPENVTPLPGNRQYDVAIVGGGLTGLWSAYYLKSLAPQLSVCVLEAHVCGFGASGRNGGWLMGSLEGEHTLLAPLTSARRSEALQLIRGIVPEVARVLEQQNISCDFHHGGGIFAAARYAEQEKIQREHLAQLHRCGHTEEDYRWLNAHELTARLNIAAPLGAIVTPHIARVQPARLTHGLLSCVRRLGVDVYEQTRVLSMLGGCVHTACGDVTATTKILAMEGFSYELTGQRRRVLPVSSRIIATEPLSDTQWRDVGLHNSEVFCEASPLVTYGQRSADNRLVFGSRGSYLFGGRPRSDFSADAGEFKAIHKLMLACFPQLVGTSISHQWGGTLGISRAQVPHAVYDAATGLGTAGGYMGEGVGAANLMARTLVDLILDRNSALATMPWAHRRHPDTVLRRWEPEPLRWLGFQLTNSILKAQESVYANNAPQWQKRLASKAAAVVASLTD